MRWRRNAPEKVIEFVPIGDGDRRAYAEKWADTGYLRSVSDLALSRVFGNETEVCLERMRQVADKAESPEELKGCRKCIEIMKELMLAPARAAYTLNSIKQMAAMDE